MNFCVYTSTSFDSVVENRDRVVSCRIAQGGLYRKVRVTGVCLGTNSDPLVAAITVQQQDMNHPQIDGKVSVVTGTGKIGAKAFFLLRLEARFAVMFPNAWPRLDLIPRCPGVVLQASRGAVPAISELGH
jgi:hypothetical protein